MSLIIKMIKTVFSKKIYVIILVAVIVIPVAALKLYKYFKKPSIADTKLIVLEIKQVKQLFTYSCYDECVVDFQRRKDDKPRFVVIAKGTVIAGFDLSDLDEKESFSIKGNTLAIKLNPPKILDVIILPSGFETFIQRGKITSRERMETQKRAVDIIKNNAIQNGLLKLSEEQGKNILIKLFESLGFDDVTVEIKTPQSAGAQDEKKD